MADKMEWRRHAWLRLEESLERRVRLAVETEARITQSRRGVAVSLDPNTDVIAHYTAMLREQREDEAVARTTLSYVRKHIDRNYKERG